jgi:hypothetical protein
MRILMGLFRGKDAADRADERLRREGGHKLEMHLMPVAQIEILKPLDLGAVTGRILGLA